ARHPRGIPYLGGTLKPTVLRDLGRLVGSTRRLAGLGGQELRVRVRGQHAFQYTLQRHRVGTGAMVMEELTGALPAVVRQRDLVVAVLAVKFHTEGGYTHPGAFCGVALGLLDLADDAGIHSWPPK